MNSVTIRPDAADLLPVLWLDRSALVLAVSTIATIVLLSGAFLIFFERLKLELDRRTQNLRLEIAERRRAEKELTTKQDLLLAHQETMARLMNAGTTGGASLTGTLRDLSKAMCVDLHLDRAGYRLLDDEGKSISIGETFIAATGEFVCPPGPGDPELFVNRLEAVGRQVLTVDDTSDSSELDFLRAPVFAPLNIQSVILAPIYLHGKLHGLLTCATTGRRVAWSAEHKLIASGFANFAALIIEHHKRLRLEAAAHAAAERLSHQQAVLNGLMQHEAVRSGNLEQLFSVVSDALSREMPVDRVAVRLFAESANNSASADIHMARETQFGHIRSAYLDRYPPPLRSAIAEGPILVEDCTTSELAAQIYESRLKPRDISAFLHAPIVVEGRLAGVINCSSIGHTKSWTSEDTLLATGAANLIALACERQLRRRIEEHLRRSKLEADEANKAKSLFLANMSHEIRTPMNGVFGMADLLARTSLDDRQRRLLDIIGQSAKTLLTVINDILDLSRIEGGKFELDNQEFALETCVEDAVALLAEEARKKGLELNLMLDKQAFGLVNGDPVRLRQVLLNVISNSIKFTSQGEVNVRVAPAAGDQSEGRIQFEIEDTGIGIAPEVVDRLFQPFSQADSSISRRFGGTGLGLWISRHLVSLMGGEIRMSSVPGKGTVIRFSLPMNVQPRSSQDDAPPQVDFASLRVLVVDDRSMNREIICSYLESAGASTEQAENGQAGIARLRAAADNGEPFQIVVVDQVMPDMDGISFCQNVSTDPSIASTRRLLLSSMSNDVSSASLTQSGVEKFLSKPIRRDDLISCVTALTSAPPQSAATDASATLTSTKSRMGLNVLLAEDNSVNQVVADEYLTALGCKVTIVENGLQAVAAFERNTFDVVLMDCQMPEMDGLTATRLIREREAERKQARTAIIAVTAHAFEQDRQRCLDAGMDDYLSKPFSEQQLTNVLSKAMEGATAASMPPSTSAGSAASVALPRSATSASPAERSPPTAGSPTPPRSQPSPATGSAGQIETQVQSGSIANLRVARPGLHAKLVNTYLDYAPNSIKALDRAAQAGDTISLKVGAHSLKSSSANVQAHYLSELSRQLEAAASADDIEQCRTVMPLLIEEFERAARQLRAEIETGPGAQAV